MIVIFIFVLGSDVLLVFLFLFLVLFFGFQNPFCGEDGSVPESGETEGGDAD